MTCQAARELFSARIDDALTADERAALDAHLASCAECPREWERFERTVALLQAVEPAHAPAGFVDRVLAARPAPWSTRLARRLFLPWPVKLPLEAGAILLIGGLVVMFVRGLPELQQQSALAPEPLAEETAPPPVSAPPAPPTTATRPAPAGRRTESGSTSGSVERKEAPEVADFRTDATAGRDAAPAAEPPRAKAAAPPMAAESPAKGGESPEAALREGEFARERAAARQLPAAPPAATAQKSTDVQRLAAPDPGIQARLAVGDRAAAERMVRDLVTQSGGQVVSETEDRGARVLSLVVPGDRWDELRRRLESLGSLRLEGQRADRAGPLRITLRLER